MYIPLNIKTEYDLMNSIIKCDDLILYAKNNNIKTLGITDTHMFGVYEFTSLCNKNNIKPIIGSEITTGLYLYARNYKGYQNLCKIVSNIDNFEEKIKKNNKDIILVTNKELYQKYNSLFDYAFIYYKNDLEKEEAKTITKDILYLPKVCYLDSQDYEYYKYIKYINESKTIDEEIEVEENYLIKNNNIEDTDTTNYFSSLIDFNFPKSIIHMPVYKEDSVSFLRALSKKGLEKRLNGNVPDEYKNRLSYELSIIEKMNYVDYFLIVYDFVLYAKKNGIMVGPGRGSGAASLVNYSLGIIDIDPLKYDLIFERFLNPDRITMPDIDIDFDDEKRHLVIDYVINKYGEKNTARIISFNTLAPKQVIRDISKVLKIDSIIIDRLCKTLKGDEKDFSFTEYNYEFNTIVSRNEELKKLITICTKLCGLKKNTSITAAGVVISDVELDTLLPLYITNNTILTGYSKEYIEDLGLLKMDFLSIKNLSTLSSIIDRIKFDDPSFDINNIKLDDKKTLYLFKNAYTTGIFQFESTGMRSFLKQLNLDNFDTLVDALALYRPGPRDMIDEYISRKNGKTKITYDIKELESILKSTYGIIIYQEQVLEILKTIAGYTYAEADNIRRAMSKKKLDVIENNREKFNKGIEEKGYSLEIANKLYDKIIKFAGYGFNKSHSVAYSYLSYKIAYLKANYPKYFMMNLLNNSKNSPKLKEYLDESKILGIQFENVSINDSGYDFRLKDNKLVLPFSLIKNISISTCNKIEEEQSKKKFIDFYDFMIRCYGQSVNKKNVISLIECGAFNEFNINKKQYIENIDEVINYVSLCNSLSLIIEEKPVFENISDYTEEENIKKEINNFGYYISHHPATTVERTNMIKLDKYKLYFDKVISLVLFIEEIKTIKTKSNTKMSFIKFSDEYGTAEGILFPEKYKLFPNIEENNLYYINAKVEKRNSEYQLIIYNIKKVKQE